MSESKPDLYRDLAEQLKALLAGEPDRIANAANMAALIYHGLPDLNWAGFYFRRGQELVLGPFQGKPACVRIPLGKGVCGTAASRSGDGSGPRRPRFSGPHRLRSGFALRAGRAIDRSRGGLGRA